MSNKVLQPPQPIESLDERIEILARELELAVQWQRPCVLLLVYSSEYVRADAEAALENCLFDLGQKAVHLKIRNRESLEAVSLLQEFKDPCSSVFLIDGLCREHERETGVYSTINLQQEFFVEKGIRAVFWLTQNEIKDLARYAPDFWAHRQRVIEFVESPRAEQVLRQALESAWQGTGEYADLYEDTDAKIFLRESLLTELPKGQEASSIRANLLLTLGILNWRKGDFEQANMQLKEALKLATRIQDPWFEAECYNAMALVKTSMDTPDEAINAYKQAIRLAPDQIFAWNNLGNLCAKIGRHDEAMIAFRKAIECNPKDPIGWNGLANLYYRTGYLDDAIAAYRKAIQYMPTFAQPWNGLGDVYAAMNRVDEAMKAYHEAIDLNQQYITPWVRLGVLFTKQDRNREAVRAYQRALDLDTRNPQIWNELGMIQLKCEDYEEAEEAFSKATELDHGYGWAYGNLALTYVRQGKYQKSVPLYLKSIDLLQDDKDKAICWNRLADVYRLTEEYESAVAAYQTADKLDRKIARQQMETPEDPALEPTSVESPVQESLSENQAEAEGAGDPDPDAVRESPEPARTDENPQKVDAPAWIFNPESNQEAAPDANAGDPQASSTKSQPQEIRGGTMPDASIVAEEDKAQNADAFAWNEKGNGCFSRGEFEDAIQAYNQAIQLDPAFGWPYGNLALTYLAQGQYHEAILLYQKSIELLKSEKDQAVSWNGLGNAYRCIDDYPNAVAAFQRAAELDPETAGVRDGADTFQSNPTPRDAKAWNELGELFFKAGTYQQAIEAFEQAIQLEPGDGVAYSNLARSLASLGEYQVAIPLYQKSIDLLHDDKEKAAVWNRLGNVYRKLNDYDHAIQAYQQAVMLADEGVTLLTRTRFSLLSNLYVDQ